MAQRSSGPTTATAPPHSHTASPPPAPADALPFVDPVILAVLVVFLTALLVALFRRRPNHDKESREAAAAEAELAKVRDGLGRRRGDLSAKSPGGAEAAASGELTPRAPALAAAPTTPQTATRPPRQGLAAVPVESDAARRLRGLRLLALTPKSEAPESTHVLQGLVERLGSLPQLGTPAHESDAALRLRGLSPPSLPSPAAPLRPTWPAEAFRDLFGVLPPAANLRADSDADGDAEAVAGADSDAGAKAEAESKADANVEELGDFFCRSAESQLEQASAAASSWASAASTSPSAPASFSPIAWIVERFRRCDAVERGTHSFALQGAMHLAHVDSGKGGPLARACRVLATGLARLAVRALTETTFCGFSYSAGHLLDGGTSLPPAHAELFESLLLVGVGAPPASLLLHLAAQLGQGADYGEALGLSVGGASAASSALLSASSAALVFIPLLNEIAARLAQGPPRSPSLLVAASFAPCLRLLAALLEHPAVVRLLVSDSATGWGTDLLARSPPPSGLEVETQTFLGRVLTLGQHKDDYIVAPCADLSLFPGIAVDLVAELAALPPQPEEGAAAERHEERVRRLQLNVALAKQVERVRDGLRVHLPFARIIIDRLAKSGCKEGREALFRWVGRLLDANEQRGTQAFQQGYKMRLMLPPGLSDAALLDTVTHSLVTLCQPFLDPSDSKAKNAARVDARYIAAPLAGLAANGNGGGRFSCAKDDRLVLPLAAESDPPTPPALATAAVEFKPTSDLFWLSVRIVHVGFLATAARFVDVYEAKQLLESRFRSHIEFLLAQDAQIQLRMEADRSAVRAVFQRHLIPRYADLMRPILAEFTELFTALPEPALVTQLQQLHRMLAVVVTQCALPDWEPSQAPLTSRVLPLLSPTLLFKALPAFVVEDIAALMCFLEKVTDLRRQAMLNSEYLSFRPIALDFAAFFVLFMGSPQHVPNPYTRGELAQALSCFTPSRHDEWFPESGVPLGYRPPTPKLHLQLASSPLEPALRQTLASLCSLYVSIGQTNTRTNHLDKLPFRVRALATIESLVLTKGSEHCDILKRLSTDAETGPGLFSDFLNDVISDVTFFTDEAFKMLLVCRDDERRVMSGEQRIVEVDPNTGQNSDPDSAQRRRLHFIRQQLACVRPQLHTMALFARIGITHPWLSRRLRGRTALFVNSLANHLCGPKRAQLRLSNAHMLEAEFRPRELLLEAAAILGGLAAIGPRCGAEPDEGGASWASQGVGSGAAGGAGGGGGGAGAEDEGESGGEAGADIMASALVSANAFLLENYFEMRRVLLDPAQLEQNPGERVLVQQLAVQLRQLHSRLEAALGQHESLDKVLGELTEAVADPLMYILMDDPVLLPTSRMIMQRSVIVQQLQGGDKKDPFTKTDLTADDFIELPAMKDAVRAWVRARQAGADGAAELAVVEREKAEAERRP